MGISPPKLWSFLTTIQNTYRAMPYHNAVHATDVTHGTNFLLTMCPGLAGVADTPHMMLACLLAAIVHDVDHDGHNVGYHIGAYLRPPYPLPPPCTHVGYHIGARDERRSKRRKPRARSRRAWAPSLL